jgi:hypothetical protein
MIYLEGLMHRKINLWLALLVIAIIAAIFALVISAKAFTLGQPVAIQVLSMPVKCVPDPSLVTCLASCPVCGSLPSCSAVWEVKARYLSGSRLVLRKGPGGEALCLTSPILFPPPMRPGSFKPMGKCLGLVQKTPAGIHVLLVFACRP